MEAKTVENIEKQTMKRLLWDGKVPGTRAGTRAATVHSLAPAGPGTGSLEDSQINSSLPCQIEKIEQHQDGPGYMKSLGGIKTK